MRFCLERAFGDISNGRASSVTLASPRERRVRMARRVGSARAIMVRSKCVGVIFNLLVEYNHEGGGCQAKRSTCKTGKSALSLPAADLRVNAFFPFFGITPALFFHIWEQTIHAGTVVENDRLP